MFGFVKREIDIILTHAVDCCTATVVKSKFGTENIGGLLR